LKSILQVPQPPPVGLKIMERTI
jgi:hypothetical protein